MMRISKLHLPQVSLSFPTDADVSPSPVAEDSCPLTGDLVDVHPATSAHLADAPSSVEGFVQDLRTTHEPVRHHNASGVHRDGCFLNHDDFNHASFSNRRSLPVANVHSRCAAEESGVPDEEAVGALASSYVTHVQAIFPDASALSALYNTKCRTRLPAAKSCRGNGR